MADISNVSMNQIKDLYESLERLSCKDVDPITTLRGLTLCSSHYD